MQEVWDAHLAMPTNRPRKVKGSREYFAASFFLSHIRSQKNIFASEELHCVHGVTSQRGFVHAQLSLHDPTQVSPNGPRGDGGFGHSFPFRICVIGSGETYGRFVIAESEEL